MGDRGRMRIDRMIKGDRRGVGLVWLNCHFIFMLFVDGNIVKDVEYVKRM